MVFALAFASALADCSPDSGGSGYVAGATTGKNALTASPSSLYFPVTSSAASQNVTILGMSAFDSNFGMLVADPTVVGYSPAMLNGRSATVSVFAVAPGATSITFLDDGGSATITTSSDQPCGRPSNLFYSSKLIVPASGSTAVATNVGTAYFAVYSEVAPSANLHVIVGAHQSFEAGPLTAASPPAGTPAAPPQAGEILTYMRATLPTLASGTSYRTQLVSDSCEPALIAGSFST